MWKLIRNGGRRELYNKGIHNLYPSTHIISDETKEDKIEGTCSTHMDVWVGENLKTREKFGDRRRWENNIKISVPLRRCVAMDLFSVSSKENRCLGMDASVW
jgi:hypothetical protein